MYSTCIHCGSALGANDVLEHFPVGRRLAFDTERGRLWVLCRRCRVWNLAPIEERWEAVEGAERLFEGAALGASSEHIAVGKLADGTQLVRIGGAGEREVAGWRYGTELVGQWKRRHRRAHVMAGALGAVPAIMGGLTVLPAYAVLFGGLYGYLRLAGRRPVLVAEDGTLLRRGDSARARLLRDDSVEGWHLEVRPGEGGPLRLTGRPALRALGAFLATANGSGAPDEDIHSALEAAQQLRRMPRSLHHAAVQASADAYWDGGGEETVPVVNDLPGGFRLALEMTVNAELEHRSLHGELALLQREWREAEELAAIADSLLLPAGVARRWREWREDREEREERGGPGG